MGDGAGLWHRPNHAPCTAFLMGSLVSSLLHPRIWKIWKKRKSLTWRRRTVRKL